MLVIKESDYRNTTILSELEQEDKVLATYLEARHSEKACVKDLRISVTMLRDNLYSRTQLGLTLKAFILFQERVEIVTDRLLVSDAGVRVLDQRE